MGGGRTYKLPNTKIPVIANFFLVGICNPHNNGIGKIRSAKLVRMSGGDVMAYATLFELIHFPPGMDRSQKYWKGLQVRN